MNSWFLLLSMLIYCELLESWGMVIVALEKGKLTYFMKNVELVGNWVMLVMALENGKMA